MGEDAEKLVSRCVNKNNNNLSNILFLQLLAADQN